MNILHISTTDILGGAARAAYRLHKGLLTKNVNSKMLVRNKRSDDPFVRQFRPSMDFKTRFFRRSRQENINKNYMRYDKKKPAGLEYFSDSRTPYNEPILSHVGNVDIINLHWIAEFIDYQSFFKSLTANTPVVWTLHDMNPFTGGCHYTGPCRRFEEKCGACPQLGSSSKKDLSRSIWNDKQEAFSYLDSMPLHIVTPSRWLSEQAKASALLGRFPSSVIPNGLDTEVFKPRDASEFRNALGIPADASIVGFVADSTTNIRKGFHYLKIVLESLDDNNIYLLSVGGVTPRYSENIKHIHLGSIQLDSWLSIAYSLFDVFICPSLEDNLPNTVIESLACGTPVVGFNVGGMPDMIKQGITGLLSSDVDAESLRICIEDILSDRNRLEAMAVQCREKALREYTLNIQAENYSRLYSSFLNVT